MEYTQFLGLGDNAEEIRTACIGWNITELRFNMVSNSVGAKTVSSWNF